MTESRPSVTIITPCLDPTPAMLAAALASVRQQVYNGRLEHIVVDGGSSREVLAVLQAAPEIEWVSEADRGQSDAMNKGLRLASGEIFTWLNADDTLDPGAVERAASAARANPDAGWFYGSLRVTNGKSDAKVLVPPHPPALSDFTEGCPIPGVGTFMRTSVVRDLGGFATDLHLAMDLDLWIRLLGAGVPAVRIEDVQATFVLHENSKTAQPDLERRYEEQVSIFTRHGHPQLRDLARARLEWFVTRRDFQAALDRSDRATARRVAWRGFLAQHGVAKRAGLATMALLPALGGALLHRTGHDVDPASFGA